LITKRTGTIVMRRQHTVTEQMEDEAMSHYFALTDAEGDLADALSKLNRWLRENPAHGVAWARARRMSRFMVLYLKATEPGASKEEIAAFFDAIKQERRRSPEEFA
jgi:ferric-dicitrate binding protein FerR (iron transport regulator)